MKIYSVAKIPNVIALSKTCVAHYKLNDNVASTTVVDSRGNYNGTAQQNTNLIHTTGMVDGAMTFNGTSDYISIIPTGWPSGSAERSVSLWCYTDSVPDAGCLFIYGGAGAYSLFGLSYYDYGVMAVARGTLGAGTIHISTDVSQILGSWVNWVTTYKGSLIKLYSNGELAWTSNSITLDTGSDIAKIGNAYDDGEYDFPGLIDNVMIFKRALTQADVTFLYNGGYGTEGLIKWT